MRRLAPLITALLLVAVTGCGDDEDASDIASEEARTTTEDEVAEESTTTAADEEDGEDGDEDGAVVELLDAGDDPRVKLRFRPEAGDSQQLTLRQTQEQRIATGGQEQASTVVSEFDIAYVVEEVADGWVSTRVVYEAARIVDADPALRPMLEDIMDQFVGAEATTVFDERGRILEAEVPDIDLAGVPGGDQILQGLEQSLSSLSVPFPDEAVGVGGSWVARGSTDLAGLFKVASATTVEVKELTDGEVRTAVSTTQTFASLPGGGVEVESGELTGSGTITFPLDGVVGLFEQTTEGTLVFVADGQRIQQFLRLSIETLPR